MSHARERLYALDAMRGVCAIALMLYHYFMWNGHDHFQIGYFGVYIFFMLSGFSLWYVYAQKLLDIALLKEFFVARVARIVPLYAAVTLLGGAARLYSKSAGALDADFFERLALNVTMLFGFITPGKTSFVPGGWSIGVEWVFYLAFPLLLIFRASLRTMLVLLVAGFGLNQLIVSAVLTQGTMVEGWNSYTHFPTFIVYFAAGIATAMAYAKFKPQRPNAVLCRAIPFVSLLLIFCYPSETPESYLKGWQAGLFVFAGMAGIFFAAQVRAFDIESKIYRFLGDISYSLYVLNFFVYKLVKGLMHDGSQIDMRILIGLSSVDSVILAYISYRFFEMPARRFINVRLLKPA